MTPILEVQDLKKYFDTPRGMLHAVDGISFQLEEGKTLGVVGESGCGKSTLGRTILHLIDSTDGKIFFQGKDVTHVNAAELRKLREDMQIIFQDPFSSLNPRMTVQETIQDPLKVAKRFSKKEIEERTDAMMETVGLAERLRHSYPHELDGGRRQRVGIARALALEPKFIVCDEPVSALDVSIQAQILNLLQDLQESKHLTYMFITHDLSVVRYISDQICVMYMGQMVEMSPSKELFQNPVHPYTKALLSAILVPDIHAKRERIILKGEVSSPVEPKPGCRFAARCAYACEGCRKAQKPVEISPGHWVVCDVVTQSGTKPDDRLDHTIS
ncbi:MAG: ATP-binding cassette domain-containing protein [Lachnospiraceae bacterium]|nr:ATP-binding cassette domain-containing protein [Lachnospiraceae bacterium]